MRRFGFLSYAALAFLLVASAASQGCGASDRQQTSSGTDIGGSESDGGIGSGGASGGTGGRASGGSAGTSGVTGGSAGVSSGGSGGGAGGTGVGGTGGISGGSGGTGAVGGNFACDEAVCVRGQSYCRHDTPGAGGMPTTSCVPFPESCTERTSCSCFCTPGSMGTCQALMNGLFCVCTESNGSVSLNCAGA